MATARPQVTGRFDHDAEILRQQEFSRLAAGIVPTLESLRFLIRVSYGRASPACLNASAMNW